MYIQKKMVKKTNAGAIVVNLVGVLLPVFVYILDSFIDNEYDVYDPQCFAMGFGLWWFPCRILVYYASFAVDSLRGKVNPFKAIRPLVPILCLCAFVAVVGLIGEAPGLTLMVLVLTLYSITPYLTYRKDASIWEEAIIIILSVVVEIALCNTW